MSNNRLKYLLEQYAANAATADEVRELFRWIRSLEDDSRLRAKIGGLWSEAASDESVPRIDPVVIQTAATSLPEPARRGRRARMAAAALVAGLVGLAGYYLLRPPQEPAIAVTEAL